METSSVERRGERRNIPPPPEIGKIVVEIWCYLPEVYTFGAESESKEIFSKKVCKKSIFHWDFDQNISKFSWKILKISSFLVQTRRVLEVLLSFKCPIKLIDQISMILLFSINSSRFSQKNVKNFHAIFNSPSLSETFLSFFHKFVNEIIEFTENFSGFLGYHKKWNFKIIFFVKNSEILAIYI